MAVGAFVLTAAGTWAFDTWREPMRAYQGSLPNCAMARQLGVAGAWRGEGAYRPHLDADKDGVACEPIPRRRS